MSPLDFSSIPTDLIPPHVYDPESGVFCLVDGGIGTVWKIAQAGKGGMRPLWGALLRLLSGRGSSISAQVCRLNGRAYIALRKGVSLSRLPWIDGLVPFFTGRWRFEGRFMDQYTNARLELSDLEVFLRDVADREGMSMEKVDGAGYREILENLFSISIGPWVENPFENRASYLTLAECLGRCPVEMGRYPIRVGQHYLHVLSVKACPAEDGGRSTSPREEAPAFLSALIHARPGVAADEEKENRVSLSLHAVLRDVSEARLQERFLEFMDREVRRGANWVEESITGGPLLLALLPLGYTRGLQTFIRRDLSPPVDRAAAILSSFIPETEA